MRKLLRFIFLVIVTSVLTLAGVAGLVYMLRDRELPLQSRLVPPAPLADSTTIDSIMTAEQMAAMEDSLQQAVIDSQANVLVMAQQQILAQRDSLNLLIGNITSAIAEQQKYQEGQITQLSAIFDAMRPDEAARVMEILDDNILISVMDNLNDKQAARILGALPVDRAQEITEMFVRGR